jgi:hypothetical protein
MIVKVGPFCRKGLSPEGETRVQHATGYRLGTLVDVHTGRGRPRSPPRQAHLYPHLFRKRLVVLQPSLFDSVPELRAAPGGDTRLAAPTRLYAG